MGLDMYALITNQEIPEVDFEDPKDSQLLHQWRKHPDLHGWMERLYRLKHGKEEIFNCAAVRLRPSDLDLLEFDVKCDDLPKTTGFFFGESRPEEKQHDIDFIQKARAAIAKGYKVFYASWW